MYTKLPRELRNMVYEALCPTDELIRLADPVCGPIWAGSEQYHVLDSDYVGNEVAIEAAETYYSRNHFDVDVGILDHFLSAQLPGGLKPYDLISHIRVRSGDEQVYKYIYMDGALDYDGLKLQLEYIRMVSTKLQHLKPLRLMNRLNIEFCVLTVNWWNPGYRFGLPLLTEVHLFNILETLRDTMYELKFASAKVTLTCDSFTDDRDYYDADNGTQEDSEEHDVAMETDEYSMRRDMTNLLALTEERWRKEQVGDSTWAPGKSFLSLLLPTYENDSNDPMVLLFRNNLERRWGTRHLLER
ncbi:hypothetical protein BDV96DRAFT_587433 [Lophiotrema nucula]|uniref:Uncharacterized protein n=1 Tax=Lophiotrema nucula TaxID=690887 RepID=A0A6A5YPD6_9PLEO|nr:hypothetical protein BDV96DRAFT_587433 [Lophiotrema nucula]